MKQYKNIILLVLMLLLAFFIGGTVISIMNGVVEQDNKEIAADTSGITLQIMSATDGLFILNLVNSSQYEADCLDGSFQLQKKEEDGNWADVAVESVTESGVTYELPSGQNRAFYFRTAGPDGGSVFSEGDYRICKKIHRNMEKANDYQDLTLTVEFRYPDILSATRSFDKPAENEEMAAKLARTLVMWQEDMEDYWNPEVETCGPDEVPDGALPEGRQWWKVTFPVKDTSGGEPVTVYVDQADGAVYVFPEPGDS